MVEIKTGDLRTPDQLRAAQALTLDAMRSGADVIFQATFFDGRWRGHADFLFKRPDRPSPTLGGWSYDIADTKLARSVKAGAILQMCVYASLLEGTSGDRPGVALRHHRRPGQASAPYRRLLGLFPTGSALGSMPASRPDWQVVPPARIPTRSTTVASAAGIRCASTSDEPTTTCRSWPGCADWTRTSHRGRSADACEPRGPRAPIDAIDGIGRPQLTRIREQARLQLQKRVTGEYVFELIPPDPADTGRGLSALPEPSPWDLFFDIEADPWATEVGLEYLLGVVEEVDGSHDTSISGRPRRRRRRRPSSASSGSSSSDSTLTPRCTSTTTAATSRAPSSA